MNIKIFITGTDTNIGKTRVSTFLCKNIKNACYWKPIQSGIPTDRTYLEQFNIFCFEEAYKLSKPVSPHLSNLYDGFEIELNKIKLPDTENPLIIEGAGGVLTPINTKETMADLIKHLNVPVFLVASSRLGTINHTCLSLEALRKKNIEILGVIMNGPREQNNKAAIEHFGKINVLGELPWSK